MNKERRARIETIKEKIEELRSLAQSVASEIEEVKSEEEEYYSNMPESLQGGEKGDKAQAAIDALDSAYTDLENLDFDEIISNLDTAAE